MFRLIEVPIFDVKVYLTDLSLAEINDKLEGYRINTESDGTYIVGDSVVMVIREMSMKRLCEEVVVSAYSIMEIKSIEFSISTLSLIVGYLIKEAGDVSIKETRPIGFRFRKRQSI